MADCRSARDLQSADKWIMDKDGQQLIKPDHKLSFDQGGGGNEPLSEFTLGCFSSPQRRSIPRVLIAQTAPAHLLAPSTLEPRHLHKGEPSSLSDHGSSQSRSPVFRSARLRVCASYHPSLFFLSRPCVWVWKAGLEEFRDCLLGMDAVIEN